MFRLRSSKKSRDGQIGIQIDSSGVSLAHVVGSGEGKARLELCEFRPCGGGADPFETLADLVRDHGLRGMPCVYVLGSERYSLHMVDSPGLKPDEFRDASRWLVQDLIDFDVSEAAVDGIQLPEDASRGRGQRLYVAVARTEYVERCVDSIQACGLQVEAVDILELCLRNASLHHPSSDGGTVFVRLGAKSGVLTLSRGENLYVARDVAIGAEQLSHSLEGVELGDGLALSSDAAYSLDALLLEVQRSLDYYESELGQSPAACIVIAATGLEPLQIVPYLSQNIQADVSGFDANDILECLPLIPMETQIQCLPAIGAALRGESEQELDLKPREERSTDVLNAPAMARICAAVIAAVCAIGVGSAWQIDREEERVADLLAQRDSLVQRADVLAANPPAFEMAPALRTRLEALEAERDSKRQILSALGNRGPHQIEGFSGHLEGFVRRPVKGLWFTRFEIQEGGNVVSIAGRALAPELVPRLLEQLRSEPVFRGIEFHQFHLNVSDIYNGVVDFQLDTRASEASS